MPVDYHDVLLGEMLMKGLVIFCVVALSGLGLSWSALVPGEALYCCGLLYVLVNGELPGEADKLEILSLDPLDDRIQSSLNTWTVKWVTWLDNLFVTWASTIYQKINGTK